MKHSFSERTGGRWRLRFHVPPYYGWTVVAIGTLCAALSSPGQSFVLSLYLEPLLEELSLSRVTVASLYSVSTLAAAACLPFAGHVADRVSGRAFLATVLLLMAGALALLASAHSAVTLVAALFALRLLGQGAIGLGTMTTTVRWFRQRRARALTTVALGYSVGEIVFPGVVYALMRMSGWRGSLLVLAGAYAVLFTPLVARLLRERRPDTEPMDGITPSVPPSQETSESMPLSLGATPLTTGEFAVVPGPAGEPRFTMREAVRVPVFWGALLSVAAMPMVLTGVIFHQVALFHAVGWSTAIVPTAFLAYAVCGVAANFASGFALERLPVRTGIAAGSVVAIAAFAAALSGLSPMLGALIYGGLLGTAGGIASATNAVIWPDYFGTESLGAIKGVVSGVRSGATALGPPLVAALMLPGGSAAPALIGVGSLLAIAGIGGLFLRAPSVQEPTSGSSGKTDGRTDPSNRSESTAEGIASKNLSHSTQ